MPEPNAQRKILIRMGEDLHKRLRIRCAELDTTIQDYVALLLGRELSDAVPRRSTKGHASAGRR